MKLPMMSVLKKKMFKYSGMLTIYAINVVLLSLAIFNILDFIVMMVLGDVYTRHDYIMFILQLCFIFLNITIILTRYLLGEKKHRSKVSYQKKHSISSESISAIANGPTLGSTDNISSPFVSPKKEIFKVLFRELRKEQAMFIDAKKSRRSIGK